MKKPRPMLVLDGLAAFADTVAERTPPKVFALLQYGKTAYTKGGDRGEFEFTEADADKLLADFGERNRDGVIDYEHQTLSGDRAPAAGWIEKLEKTKDGVTAHVRYWTEEASKLLRDGAYRYFSPVLAMTRRHPLALHSVALTNHPATHGIPALVADDTETDEPEENREERTMDNLKKIAEALGVTVVALADGKGMDEAATLAAVLAKVKDLQTVKGATDEFVKLHDAADLGAVTGKIKGMVPATDKQALEQKLARIEAEKAVELALADGKLVAAQKEWAIGYATVQPQAFAAFVAAAPKVAPGPAAATGVTTTATSAKTVALTDSELKVYRIMGLADAQIDTIRKDRTETK